MLKFAQKAFAFIALWIFASFIPILLHAQQMLEVKSPQGDDVIAVHVDGGDNTLFDLYDAKDLTTRIATYDLMKRSVSNVDMNHIDEVKRVATASNDRNNVTPYQGPAPGTGHGAVAASSSGVAGPSTSELPACPMASLANYWNGTSWLPMRSPEMLNGARGFSTTDRLKNPFNPSAGNTGIVRFKGPSAPITVSSSPTFCFFIPPNASIDFLVGFVDVKGDHREIEFHQKNIGPEKWIPPKRQKASTTKFVGSAAIVTLNDPLPAGQYIVGWNNLSMYDFGVN